MKNNIDLYATINDLMFYVCISIMLLGLSIYYGLSNVHIQTLNTFNIDKASLTEKETSCLKNN